MSNDLKLLDLRVGTPEIRLRVYFGDGEWVCVAQTKGTTRSQHIKSDVELVNVITLIIEQAIDEHTASMKEKTT